MNLRPRGDELKAELKEQGDKLKAGALNLTEGAMNLRRGPAQNSFLALAETLALKRTFP